MNCPSCGQEMIETTATDARGPGREFTCLRGCDGLVVQNAAPNAAMVAAIHAELRLQAKEGDAYVEAEPHDWGDGAMMLTVDGQVDLSALADVVLEHCAKVADEIMRNAAPDEDTATAVARALREAKKVRVG